MTLIELFGNNSFSSSYDASDLVSFRNSPPVNNFPPILIQPLLNMYHYYSYPPYINHHRSFQSDYSRNFLSRKRSIFSDKTVSVYSSILKTNILKIVGNVSTSSFNRKISFVLHKLEEYCRSGNTFRLFCVTIYVNYD